MQNLINLAILPISSLDLDWRFSTNILLLAFMFVSHEDGSELKLIMFVFRDGAHVRNWKTIIVLEMITDVNQNKQNTKN